jgi:hypothetical protein
MTPSFFTDSQRHLRSALIPNVVATPPYPLPSTPNESSASERSAPSAPSAVTFRHSNPSNFGLIYFDQLGFTDMRQPARHPHPDPSLLRPLSSFAAKLLHQNPTKFGLIQSDHLGFVATRTDEASELIQALSVFLRFLCLFAANLPHPNPNKSGLIYFDQLGSPCHENRRSLRTHSSPVRLFAFFVPLRGQPPSPQIPTNPV